MTSDRFFELACRKSVARRALIIALIVGVVLAVINHGDKILTGHMQAIDWIKVGLTFFVPYSVSTISSVLSLREQKRILADLKSQMYSRKY